MKETQTIGTDLVRDVRQAEVRTKVKKYTLVRERTITLWELNMATGLIVPATIEAPNIIINEKMQAISEKGKLLGNPGCLYKYALNLKNAKRKFHKEGMEILAEQQKQQKDAGQD